eukprot:CCRYP_008693-RA/>CCRYP_008693-RA protein AED:0.03 eAED:0.03 QI:92/1/1/1/0.66/0.75/4/2971/765
MLKMTSTNDLTDTLDKLNCIDGSYECVGCLAHGSFSSVFLAKTRRKGRRVALKVMPMDTRDDEEYKTFIREIDAVMKLNAGNESGRSKDDRDQSIIFFEDWYISNTFVCICMKYADGGTLAQEIKRKASRSPVEPYAERRIAWYALQLADALSFVHERGVAHHDVKSGNILIDASKGGKLLLADFGTSVQHGEESVGFTKSYAPPELLASYELDDFSNLRHEKTDAFGFGCVLYELLICDSLENISKDETLAQFIDRAGVEAAMMLPHMRLPWLPPNDKQSIIVGYSDWTKQLVISLLRRNVKDRLLPRQVREPLRSQQSPLVLDYVIAAKAAKPGAPLTIDNIQLGLLVQRGCHWDDGDSDGGIGSIGVVTQLDTDATYTWVTFPSTFPATIEPLCCRIGSAGKFELQVAPAVCDYVAASRSYRQNGTVVSQEKTRPGQILNLNCMVVGVHESRNILFAAPLEKKMMPPQPAPIIWRTDTTAFASPAEYCDHPGTWNLSLGLFVDKLQQEESDLVRSLFYGDKLSGAEKLSESEYPVEKIQRVQDTRLWESYACRKGKVALENWGLHNEIRAFLVCERIERHTLRDFQTKGKEFSINASLVHHKFNVKSTRSGLQMILCRVILGRVYDANRNTSRQRPVVIREESCHSRLVAKDLYASRGTSLIYPEYVITYCDKSNRAKVGAASTTTVQVSSTSSNSKRSPTKLCVICMENPVRYVLIPCGHTCLCSNCCAPSRLRKLNKKCPECRTKFSSAMAIYGRIVEDD